MSVNSPPSREILQTPIGYTVVRTASVLADLLASAVTDNLQEEQILRVGLPLLNSFFDAILDPLFRPIAEVANEVFVDE